MKNSGFSRQSERKSVATGFLLTVFFLVLGLMVANQVVMNVQARQEQVYAQQIAEMRVLLQDIARRTTAAAAGNSRAFQLLEYAQGEFRDAWTLLNEGNPAYISYGPGLKAALAGQRGLIESNFRELPDLWSMLDANITRVLQARETLLARATGQEITIDAALADALAQIAVDTEEAQLALDELGEYFYAGERFSMASPLAGFALLAVLLLTILIYAWQVIGQSRDAEKTAAERHQHNNRVVQKLVSEISGLADGDLTVEATASEEFTGTIAESINYAVEQLRGLVAAITDVTVEVTASTDASRVMVEDLSAASRRQSQSIDAVHVSIRKISNDINLVSGNADKSMNVAQESVRTAAGGAEIVKDTIRGMDSIREQIQDTSRRIKRLGESSQEIGGFVSLINDIAEHTNTLSLNAAIQAASAGESGKGFAVVPDEVHALAERSADATRKIESLVRIIQADIKEAVRSMEQTTAEVVAGTGLARKAGTALDDIQQVSRELAELVSSITDASRNQSRAAEELKGSMEVITQVTAVTSNGIEQTRAFMSKLGNLSEKLRLAVAGFSLNKQDKWKGRRKESVAALLARQESSQPEPRPAAQTPLKLQQDNYRHMSDSLDGYAHHAVNA